MMDAHGNQVLHVRGDSDTQMESLFNVLKQVPSQQNSLRNRNLPKSFFEPPARPSHSREGSQDSTNFNPLLQLAALPGQPTSTLPINHGRSQSSPAQLPLSLSAAPTQTQHHHSKQNSVDFVEEMGQLRIPSGPAPWDSLKSAPPQRYFANSQEQLAWPKSLSTNTLNASSAQGSHTPQGTLSPGQSHTSPSVSLQNVGPLPRGWEQGVTPDGEVYFINHVDRTTSWFDPRIPKNLQRPGPIKLGLSGAVQPLQQSSTSSQQPPPPQLPQPAIQVTPLATHAKQQAPAMPSPSKAQVSPGQTQQVSPAQPGTTATATLRVPANSSSSSNNQNPQLIQYELERLKQEKDRLQREQEEIGKRELLLKEMMSVPKHGAGSDLQHGPAPPPTSIQSVSTSGTDPFLGQGSNNVEAHARQNSGDSGLGGMGTNYSLPRTPEDFLGNVDEMDMQENNMIQMLKPANSDFNMNDLQSTVCSMDVGSLGDPEQSGMEEDLVPTLPEDITSLGTDLLADVDKMETLLWL